MPTRVLTLQSRNQNQLTGLAKDSGHNSATEANNSIHTTLEPVLERTLHSGTKKGPGKRQPNSTNHSWVPSNKYVKYEPQCLYHGPPKHDVCVAQARGGSRVAISGSGSGSVWEIIIVINTLICYFTNYTKVFYYIISIYVEFRKKLKYYYNLYHSSGLIIQSKILIIIFKILWYKSNKLRKLLSKYILYN